MPRFNFFYKMKKGRKAKHLLLSLMLITLIGVYHFPKSITKRRRMSDKMFIEKMELRMAGRRQHIKKICEERGLKDDIDSVRHDVIYSGDYNILFCQIPKTGMTNWMKVFAKLDGITSSGHANKLSKPAMKKALQIDGQLLANKLKDENVLKLLVVREPMERLISAYRDKLGEDPISFYRKMSKKIHKQFGNTSLTGSEYASFNEFVKHLITFEDIDNTDYHWMKYRQLCQPCAVHYDFIIHQETVAEDSRYFLNHIQAPNDVILGGAYYNPTDKTMIKNYYSTVTPSENLWKLYELFKEDYFLFNYSKPFVLR